MSWEEFKKGDLDMDAKGEKQVEDLVENSLTWQNIGEMVDSYERAALEI